MSNSKNSEVLAYNVSYKDAIDSFKAVCRTLRADLVSALEKEDETQVLAIRTTIVAVNKLADILVNKTFDATVDFVHTSNGEDFLPNVTRIYKPRGRSAGEKKVVDPFA